MRLTLAALRTIITEAAVNASSLPSKVGLIFSSNKWAMQMALVDLDVIDDFVVQAEAGDGLDGVEKALIGGITATREDVWRVNAVSADHGYGPLLYRLAMQFATSQGSALSAHQSGITSDEATSVWKRFEREPDVTVVNITGQRGIRGKAYKMAGNDFERLALRYTEMGFKYDDDIRYLIFNEVRSRA